MLFLLQKSFSQFFVAVFVAVAVTVLCFSKASAQTEGADQTLLPAALGIRTDAAGNSWNIESNGTIGRIGSTMVNSGLALEVNDEAFASFQPSMTADGKEFILNGKPIESLPGLQVQRRIRLIPGTGGLRYVELFYNASPERVVINVSLVSNFSGNYKTFISNRGRTEPVILQEPESGIIVTPGSSQSTKAFLFTLAAPGPVVKPTIAAQNRYGLTFRYPLEIPPGETRSVVHIVSQVVIPQVFDRRTLLSLFRPLSFSENGEVFDSRWNETVVNNLEVSSSRDGMDLKAPLLELGVERGSKDILAIGKDSRLIGDVTGESVSLESEYGDADFPLARIAAIEGMNGVEENTARLYLRDGQVISGKLTLNDLSFSQIGGERSELRIEELDRLVLATSEQDDFELENGDLVVETYRGDRLRVEAGAEEVSLTGRTPWGSLSVPIKQLLKLYATPEMSLAYRMEAKNGIQCVIYPAQDELKVTLTDFGVYTFQPMELKSLTNSPRSLEEMPKAVDKATVFLRGEQSLIGQIGNTTLPVVTEEKVLDTASSDIRVIERLEGASFSSGGLPIHSPLFRIEKWDGGEITGYLNLDTISFNVEGESWTIPIQDIERVEAPSPDLSPDISSAIRDLVEKLGADSWPVREQATKELGAFGYLAVPFLQRELSASTDPEVSRRLERVLAGLN